MVLTKEKSSNLLIHASCLGNLQIDLEKPIIVTFDGLAYFIKCSKCNRALGILYDVQEVVFEENSVV